MLDEWDNAEVAELTQVRHFMVDFQLNDDGELSLQGFGERLLDDIWARAYPVLSKAMSSRDGAGGDASKPAVERRIRKAVQAEKERLTGKRKPKAADTELGKTVQDQTGAPAALINRYVRHVATEMLEKTPTPGRKQ